MDFPIFENEKYKMREMTLNDIEDVFEYYQDEEFMRYTSSNTHQVIEDTALLIQKLSASFHTCKGIAWAIEDKDKHKCIGNIGLYYIGSEKSKAGIGYNVNRNYQKQGIATWALANCLAFGLETLKLERIECSCKAINLPSERVMQKCGMTLEGIKKDASQKDGVFYDVLLYAAVNGNVGV